MGKDDTEERAILKKISFLRTARGSQTNFRVKILSEHGTLGIDVLTLITFAYDGIDFAINL